MTANPKPTQKQRKKRERKIIEKKQTQKQIYTHDIFSNLKKGRKETKKKKKINIPKAKEDFYNDYRRHLKMDIQTLSFRPLLSVANRLFTHRENYL